MARYKDFSSTCNIDQDSFSQRKVVGDGRGPGVRGLQGGGAIFSRVVLEDGAVEGG